MTLSKFDMENIEKLLNTEEIILGVYNELIQLEANKQYMEMNSKYDYLKTLYLIEANMFKDFDDLDKYQEIADYIDNKYGNKDSKIIQRIINKLNNLLMEYKYSELNNKQEISTQEMFMRSDIVTTQIKQFISDDINNIFRAYLINFINSCDNVELKDYLIQYKFYNLYSNLSNVEELDNINDNPNVYLSYNGLFQILSKKNIVPGHVLDYILSEHVNHILNFFVNDLISISDKDLLDSEKLVQAYILSFYIKSCLLFGNENSLDTFKKQIDNDIYDSRSKQILMNSIDEVKNNNNKPKIYYVNFLK